MVIESGSRSSKGTRRSELRLSENARVVLERRYLAKDDAGKPIETPEQLFRRVAHNLAQAERNYGADEARLAEVEETFYHTLTHLDFLPNSPTLGNAGRPLQQLSACFVLPVEDSIDRIFDTLKATALVHQSGGGTGFAFSRLRPEGSLVRSTSGVASGPVSFMKVFDASTEAIKQGGTRRGANMGILSVDHPDIEKFIECKADMVTCTNFNISVAVTEKFMQAAERGEEYELVDPHTGKVTGTRNARAIFEKLVANAWQNGDPGIVFIDRINADRANPVPKLGPIESTNPCVTGDTLVYTGNGLRRAAELAAEGTPLRVAVDGEQGFALASPVFRTGRKPVFRVHTAEGYELRLTADHRVMTRRGWVAAQDLREGDAIRLLSHKGGFGTVGSLALGRLLGWLVGDGTFADDRAVLSFFGEEKRELAPVFAEMMAAEVPDGLGRRGSYPIRVEEVKGRDEARVRSARFMRIAAEFGLAPGNKHQVPEGIFTGSEEMQRGFLQA
ncbi:MAG TPA: ribonucleotide reductase N-terminal alpha domain-containing protein, partial [Dehalococcoidia bacterium]|nr:ribonucleotide reductase N-terminal alpha domain-containing protein [Dehalococcoidia bacterium]